MTDEEYEEEMKFSSDDHEIDIATVTFRVETAEDICKRLDIANFMNTVEEEY